MLYAFTDMFCGAIVPLAVLLVIFIFCKEKNAKKAVLLVLFTLYLAEMLDVVGFPYAQTAAWKPIINLIPFSDIFKEDFSFWTIFQFAANIALFIPFGILLPVIWKRFRRLSSTITAGALMSICIELVQLFSFRVTAVDDWIMNTLGTLLGYLIIAGLRNKRWKDDTKTRSSVKHDYIELLIIVGMVFISTLFTKEPIARLVYSMPLFS